MSEHEINQSTTKYILNLWRNISLPAKTAFLSCFISGFIIHLFAFTNIIPNSDGLSRVFDYQQMTISGRWFLHYASAFNRYLQAPALIGFLSVLFLSLTAGVITSLFKIESNILSGILGITLIAFPSVAYTFLYMFTASAYFFGLLLAVLGVLLTERYKFGFVMGALLLSMSVGTYQSYVCAAITLSLMLVLLNALKSKTTLKEIIIHGLKHIAFIALGMVLYFVVLKIFLYVKDLELLSYLNMNELSGNYPLSKLPSILKTTVGQYIKYFIVPDSVCTYTTKLMSVINVLIIAASVIIFVSIIIKNEIYKKPLKLIAIVLLISLLPIAMNFVQIMNPGSEATPIMRYSFVFAYVLAILLVDRSMTPCKMPIKAIKCVCVLLIVFISFLNYQTDNIVYTVSAQAHRATESYVTRLVARVEATDGYSSDIPVVIIGGFPDDRYNSNIQIYSLVEHYSCISSNVIPLNKHIYYYLNDWLNIPWEEPEENVMKAVSENREFKNMPLYPDDGSVKIIDGMVVVKVQESYTPKQQYEIDYEKRR